MSLYSLRFCAFVCFVVFNTGVTFSTLLSQDGNSSKYSMCKDHEFLCSTGNCIQFSLQCDGVKNCDDGSDESEELCDHRRLARQTQGNCRLPEQPLNGHYSLGGCDLPTCRPVAGTVIPYAMLNYSCNAGYQLSGSRVLFCGKSWSSVFPTCEEVQTTGQICSPLKSSSQIIKCYFGSEEVRCDQPMKSNTRADVSCKDRYDAPPPHNKFSVVCQNGSWTKPLIPCSSKCGEYNYVGGNSNKNQSDYFLPWDAAIFRLIKNSLQYICSATIISSRAVVSAAHCVWNDGKIFPAEEIAIQVRKNKQLVPDSPTQYMIEVEEIFVASRFRGLITNYADDISVITLKKNIEFNKFVFPVCVDFENKYSPLFTPGKRGIVTSWSAATKGNKEQSILNFTYVSFEDCEKNVPKAFSSYLTYDKFCAGDINNTGLCAGDSGVGLAHQFKDGLWYLTGILSIGVSSGSDVSCQTRFYSGFTRVSLYMDFIGKIKGIRDSDVSQGSVVPQEPGLSCSDKEFQCQSSECIDDFHLCDGEKHCADGSDETSDACSAQRCPTWSFQCQYGACIKKSEVCNGVNNCADGSDESLACKSNGTDSGVDPAQGCKLPKKPENGNYQVRGCIDPSRIAVGSIVPQFTYLNYTCNPGYKLTGLSIIACDDGWSSTLPTCDTVQCPALNNPSREVRCASDFDEGNCEGVPLNVGTKVTVHCAPHFEQIPGLETYDMVCEAKGEWSRPLQSCVPKCGVPNPGGLPLVGFGIESQLGVFPWHIGFYRELRGVMTPFCGGSLISGRVVVSAAHCFWEPDGTILKDFNVVAGKYYFDWNNKTKYVQHLQVKDIVLPKRYRGPGRNYANDIALIVLVHDVQINEAVRPVCVDYERSFLRYFSPRTTIGNVTGWGLDQNQNQTKVLHIANLPYVDVDECERSTPVDFSSILTNDKFCAGNKNKTTVCRGDSGGGYTVRFRNNRWYLVGIVSIGPHEKCALYPYATFTNVFDHLRFIRQHTLEYL